MDESVCISLTSSRRCQAFAPSRNYKQGLSILEPGGAHKCQGSFTTQEFFKLRCNVVHGECLPLQHQEVRLGRADGAGDAEQRPDWVHRGRVIDSSPVTSALRTSSVYLRSAMQHDDLDSRVGCSYCLSSMFARIATYNDSNRFERALRMVCCCPCATSTPSGIAAAVVSACCLANSKTMIHHCCGVLMPNAKPSTSEFASLIWPCCCWVVLVPACMRTHALLSV